MCGIAGIFFPSTRITLKVDLSAMASAMAHRGPDGVQSYASDTGCFQAVFTRLAIIDTETGMQPLVEDGGKRVLLGNGEIYNYRELRKDFPDYPYRTHGDMETVLAVSHTDSENWLLRLNGMYGIALYDRDAGTLSLVRDRLGVKPLYWSRTDAGAIAFSSEIKALFASGLIEPRVCQKSVSSYLAHGYVPAPATFFDGVFKLPAAHRLSARKDGTITIDRYWSPQQPDSLPSDSEGTREYLSDLLADSIKMQLRSDVPLGALLSGGIDSGMVTALATARLDTPLRTFSARFSGGGVDETPDAARVADRYQTKHSVVEVSDTDATALLPLLAWTIDEPLNDPALLPNYLIHEKLSAHIKVALNGTGGDELFAGYERYFQRPVEKRYLAIPECLRHGVIEPLMDVASPMTAWRLRRGEKFLNDIGGYLHDQCSWFPPPIRDQLESRLPIPDPAQRGYAEAFDGPNQSKALFADLNTYLIDGLLPMLDRASMAASVEGRVPFLDHRLVEAALFTPPTVRAPNGERKGLAKRIARDYLPSTVVNAPKRGFASPVPAWMTGALGKVTSEILTRPAALARGWWSEKGIRRLYANPTANAFPLYALLMMELCVTLHIDRGVRTRQDVPSLQDIAHGS